jgi:predicted hydrocarbon binding protein
MIRSRFDWVKEAHPDADRKSIIDALPTGPKSRFARGVLASEWYEFGDLIALDKLLVDRFGKEHPELLKDFGRHSAKTNVTNVIASMSIHDFLRGSSKLHDRFQDFGAAAYEQTSETSGKMVFTGYHCFSPIYCESAFGFFEQCIILFGGKSPKVVELTCHCRGDQSCTFSMSWS